MIKFQEYIRFDAIDLSRLLQDKSISSYELIETAFAAIKEFNPIVNAICMQESELALQQIENISHDAVLPGVPFLLKDLGAFYQGMITTNGSRLFRNAVAPINTEYVNRYRQAGLVIIGKTSTPELGLSYTTEPELFGPCHNPWDLNLTSGGSSGGAAAAVALGIVPAAHASDGGGSIRVPASCCGLFGMKPTRARVPMGPIVGEGWAGLSTSHVISRTVRDSALLLDIAAGPMLGDPYYAPYQDESFLTMMKKPLRRLRIAFSLDSLSTVKIDPECKQAVMNAVKLCEELGHHVEAAHPQYDYKILKKIMQIIVLVNLRFLLDYTIKQFNLTKLPEGSVEALTFKLYEEGKKYYGADYVEAIFLMQQQSRLIAQFFQKYDLLLTPTIATLPAPLGYLQQADSVEEYFEKQAQFSPFASVANQTGMPAMSVPLHWTEKNIPVGVQFMGKFGDEVTLFQLAHQLETAKPWRHLYPELVKNFVSV